MLNFNEWLKLVEGNRPSSGKPIPGYYAPSTEKRVQAFPNYVSANRPNPNPHLQPQKPEPEPVASGTQTFDRNVLKQLQARLEQNRGSKVDVTTDEWSHLELMLKQARQKIVSQLDGPLRQAWEQYLSWEKKYADQYMTSAQGNLGPAIKNGGPGVAVQEIGGSVVVPTELYNALYWRSVIKLGDGHVKSRYSTGLRTVLPKLAHLFR